MIIKEFLPNPIGSDKEGEYIKLLNDGQEAVLLNGWRIKDASGKTYDLSGSLSDGQELVLPYSQTKIFLNNSGEEILLYNSAGELIDQLNYSGQAEEGQIIFKQLAISESKNEETNLPITNYQLPTSNTIFLGFLIAIILSALGLYIVKQLEKKLDIKLW